MARPRCLGALAGILALLLAAPISAVIPITRDLVIWYGDPPGAGRSELYLFCNGTQNPSCPNFEANRLPQLGNHANSFAPLTAAPIVDSNGHLIILDENTTGIPGTADAAVVRRIEMDFPGPGGAHPDGLVVNVALLGGFSGNPGPSAPRDTVLVHNRVLVIADEGPSSATAGINVNDGQLLRVDLASGAATVVPVSGGLVNPSALVADSAGQLYVADVLAGFSPARPVLLRVDPVTGARTTVASDSTGFDPTGPAIDIALLSGGDVVWVSQTPGFLFFEIMRVDPSTGAGTLVAQFGPVLATPKGLAVDLATGLVLLAAQVNPVATNPDTGLPYNSVGAFLRVNVNAPFNAGNPTANLTTYSILGFLQTRAPLGLTFPPLEECNDGIANFNLLGADFEGVDLTGDGLDDPAIGCSGPYDVSEAFDCSDGLDNDLDGRADRSIAFGPEAGCEPIPGLGGLFDASEEPDCRDRLDNDGDGDTDYYTGLIVATCSVDSDCNFGQTCRSGACSPASPVATDPGCLDFDSAIENPQCSDGLDNDADGLVDWPADLVCAGPEEDSEALTACNDGVDNDGDGTLDFGGGLLHRPCQMSTDCAVLQSCLAGFCDPPAPAPPDPGCRNASDTNEAAGPCSDGLDNDGDGLVDAAGGLVFAACAVDVDCQSAQICPGGGCRCADQLCVPGTPTGPDPGCLAGFHEEVVPCNDGIDNDGDRLIDAKGLLLTATCNADADCDDAAIPLCLSGPTPTGPRAPCTCEGGFCKVGSDPGCGGGIASRIENPQCDDGLENEDPATAGGDDRIDFAGLDQNGDGVFDFFAGDRFPDPGCRFPWSDDESPECNDGLNNDGEMDGISLFDAPLADLPCHFTSAQFKHCGALCLLNFCSGVDSPDPGCVAPWDDNEHTTTATSCGAGAELPLLLVPWWMARRWRHRRPSDAL